jgi:hypothetical protein
MGPKVSRNKATTLGSSEGRCQSVDVWLRFWQLLWRSDEQEAEEEADAPCRRWYFTLERDLIAGLKANKWMVPCWMANRKRKLRGMRALRGKRTRLLEGSNNGRPSPIRPERSNNCAGTLPSINRTARSSILNGFCCCWSLAQRGLRAEWGASRQSEVITKQPSAEQPSAKDAKAGECTRMAYGTRHTGGHVTASSENNSPFD